MSWKPTPRAAFLKRPRDSSLGRQLGSVSEEAGSLVSMQEVQRAADMGNTALKHSLWLVKLSEKLFPHGPNSFHPSTKAPPRPKSFSRARGEQGRLSFSPKLIPEFPGKRSLHGTVSRSALRQLPTSAIQFFRQSLD